VSGTKELHQSSDLAVKGDHVLHFTQLHPGKSASEQMKPLQGIMMMMTHNMRNAHE
jgi:hypothetical protein